MEEKGYLKIDQYDEKCVSEMAEHYKAILRLLGEDPDREGLLKSPERIAKAMLFFTNGYDLDPEEILRSAMFHEDYKQMVVVKDIELYSLCEHHMVPFVGKAHVAYIPNGTIVGLSKIPRVVDAYARRLQVQERLTKQIKDCIQKTLNPIGVAVHVHARCAEAKLRHHHQRLHGCLHERPQDPRGIHAHHRCRPALIIFET